MCCRACARPSDGQTVTEHDTVPVQFGNAQVDGAPIGRWLLGHFVPPALGLRHTDDVEVKWSAYETGFGESEWTACQTATTIAILIAGKHRIEFPHRVFELTTPGDYVIWGPGVPHRWRVLDDSTIVAVRWPSVAGDTSEVSDDAVSRFSKKHGERCGRD